MSILNTKHAKISTKVIKKLLSHTYKNTHTYHNYAFLFKQMGVKCNNTMCARLDFAHFLKKKNPSGILQSKKFFFKKLCSITKLHFFLILLHNVILLRTKFMKRKEEIITSPRTLTENGFTKKRKEK